MVSVCPVDGSPHRASRRGPIGTPAATRVSRFIVHVYTTVQSRRWGAATWLHAVGRGGGERHEKLCEQMQNNNGVGGMEAPAISPGRLASFFIFLFSDILGNGHDFIFLSYGKRRLAK